MSIPQAQSKASTSVEGRNLKVTRIINATPDKVFKAWTDPKLLVQWFAPKPYTTPSAEIDVRPGGSALVVMRSPEGKDLPVQWTYLEVVENKRIVATDAYVNAWEPSPKPFITVDLNLEDLGGKTRYTAIVRHWTLEDLETHEKMGFHEGWSQCVEQLAALVE